jgi:hypothetical protein
VAGRHLRGAVDDTHAGSASVIEPVIEVRARVEVWISPWLTLGGELGAGVLQRSEWVGLVDLGFHARAFGGQR